MAAPSLATIRCDVCRRSVPITRARRIRVHQLVPGGQVECSASRTAVVVVPVTTVLPARPPLRMPRPLPTQWAGPRRWEDADF
jgi:hypothetical protein